MELIRFFGVSLFGALIDISIAYGLATLLGTPLWIAATLGFLTAAGTNYLAHEIWTFQNGSKSISGMRAVQYLVTSVIVILARISVIFALERALAENHTLLILICGAGVSFFANFALSKIFVFSDGTTKADASP